MTGTQWVVLFLVGTLSAAMLWLIFVLIPGYLWTHFTVRLREVHRQMAKLFADDPQLEELEGLNDIDHFLHHAIDNRSHFGLSGALTVLLGGAYLRPDADEADPFENLSYTQRLAVASVVSDSLRLTFIRAFLGSSLWFVTWPLAIWASNKFSRIEVTDEDWNTTARNATLESFRERAGGGWPLVGASSHSHQTVA